MLTAAPRPTAIRVNQDSFPSANIAFGTTMGVVPFSSAMTRLTTQIQRQTTTARGKIIFRFYIWNSCSIAYRGIYSVSLARRHRTPALYFENSSLYCLSCHEMTRLILSSLLAAITALDTFLPWTAARV